MGSGNTGPQERAVPEEEWGETLSRFQVSHTGRRVSVQIEEPDGTRTELDFHAKFELHLTGASEAERGEPRCVRLVIHQHPGPKTETVEVEEPIRILQRGGSLVLETAGGRRVLIGSFPG
jgi:hypothetical protein